MQSRDNSSTAICVIMLSKTSFYCYKPSPSKYHLVFWSLPTDFTLDRMTSTSHEMLWDSSHRMSIHQGNQSLSLCQSAVSLTLHAILTPAFITCCFWRWTGPSPSVDAFYEPHPFNPPDMVINFSSSLTMSYLQLLCCSFDLCMCWWLCQKALLGGVLPSIMACYLLPVYHDDDDHHQYEDGI